MNKRPNLKPGETSIIAKFNTMNGASFQFKKRGLIEEVVPDFLNQAKAAGHNVIDWNPFEELKQHFIKKKKELNESFEKEFK